MKEVKNSVFTSIAVTKIILFSFVSLLASLTIFTHIAQIFHLTFEEYSSFSLKIAVVALVGIIIISRKWLSQITVNDQGILFFILVIGIIGASLALIIHRPDTDDFYYVPNPVYYLQNPTMEMGFDIHFFHVDGMPFVSHMLGTALPYEYIQAIIAYYTKTEYLFVYYLFFPAIVGFLIPLSLFYALSFFSEQPRNNAIAVLITILFMLLLGETHKTVGNFSFARAFHGKVLFLSSGIPMFTAFSFDFLRKPLLFSWIALFAVATSMVGATATACILLPALASVFMIIYLTEVNKYNLKQSLCSLFLYLLALGYVLLYTIAIREYAVSYAGIDSPLNARWPTTFMGHLNFFINREIPLTPLLAIMSIIISLILSEKRKELLIWTFASILLYLNPFSAHFLIENVTSPNIYWRMFYILPFPLTMGISFSCILTRFSQFLPDKRLIILTLTSVMLLLGFHLPLRKASVFRPSNGVDVRWPSYKISPRYVLLARKIIQVAPPGIMLAPKRIAGTISMLNSQYPQIISRTEGVKTWLTYRGQSEEAQLRINAEKFVDGDNSQFDSFKTLVLRHPDLQSIGIVRSIWARATVREFLDKNGFTLHQEIDQNFILTYRD